MTASEAIEVPEPHLIPEGGLKSGALHAFDTIIMALAGSAPAYSLAATTPILVASAGLYGPASLLWCAVFGIAGHALGAHWDSVHHAFRYADYAAVALLAGGAVTLLVRRRRMFA